MKQQLEPSDRAAIIETVLEDMSPLPWTLSRRNVVDPNGVNVGTFVKIADAVAVGRIFEHLQIVLADYQRLRRLEASRQGHDARQELPEFEEVVLVKDRSADIYGFGRVVAKIEGKNGIKAKWEVMSMGRKKVLEPGSWWRLDNESL